MSNHRETRRAGSSVPAASVDAPGQKRKRPSEQEPAPTSLKVTLPSLSSTTTPGSTAIPKVRLTLSPTKVNGALPSTDSDAPETKKQKISLKVNGAKVAGAAAVDGGEDGIAGVVKDTVDGEGDLKQVAGDVVEKQKEVVHALSRDVREALSIVIQQMAVGLPSPLNDILTLWLPPTFEQIKTNTLGFILRRTDLTWDELVDLLHLMSSNFLEPCQYPNPFPALPDIHHPVPPLASHQPPHGLYDFCASLRDIMLAIEPSDHLPRSSTSTSSSTSAEESTAVQRWALVMRAPSAKGGPAQTWWSSPADSRAVREALSKLRGAAEKDGKKVEGEGLLEVMAADGSKFGFAQPVSLTAMVEQETTRAPTLGERLISKASLKAKQWKAQLDSRPRGFFGSIRRPVGVPTTSILSTDIQTPFTPTFACTYDSNKAAGGMGYWSTLDAMHYKARYSGWKTYLADATMGEAKQGFAGSLPPRWSGESADDTVIVDGEAVVGVKEGLTDVLPAAGEQAVETGASGEVREGAVEQDKGGVRSADPQKSKETAAEQLDDNAVWINELLGWQEMRAFNGVKDIGERENLVAETLQDSLVRLVSSEAPSSIIALQTGDAHDLAKRLIPTASPNIRGTLDPARPKAVHDNYTIALKPPAAAPVVPPRQAPSATPTAASHAQGGLSMAQQLAGTPSRQYASAAAPNVNISRKMSTPSTGVPPVGGGTPGPRYPYSNAPQQPMQQQQHSMGRPPMPGPPPSGSGQYPGYGSTGAPPYRPPTPGYGYTSPLPPAPGMSPLPSGQPRPQSAGMGMNMSGGTSPLPYARPPMMQPSPSPVSGNVMLPHQGQGPVQNGQGYPPQPQQQTYNAGGQYPPQGMGAWHGQQQHQPPQQPYGQAYGGGYQHQQPPPPASPMGPGVNMGMPMGMGGGGSPAGGIGGVNVNMPGGMGMGMPPIGMPQPYNVPNMQGLPGMQGIQGMQGMAPGGYGSPAGVGPGQGPGQAYGRPGMPSGLRQSFGPT